MIKKDEEKMIILFGFEDGCPSIQIFFEKDKENHKYVFDKTYMFILDIKKLPIQTIPLFDRMSYTDLQTTKALFLLHICKSYLEVYKYDD